MKKIIILSALAVAIIVACKSGTETKANAITINLDSKSKSNVTGTATFFEKDGKVVLKAKISGLQPGTHAIHIHEKADCSSTDATSAGGHWNPTFKKHGKWVEAEHHKGDIGNFTTNQYGEGTVSFSTDEWCIGCGDANKDIIGKGLIVHADSDDFTTQPTGNAGARVACAGIIK